MNPDVEAHLDTVTAHVRSLFVKAATRIENLKIGEKIPATTLADDLAKELGMTGPTLYPTLKILFTGYPGVAVRKGAHGGIIRLPLPGTEVKENVVVTDVPVETDSK